MMAATGLSRNAVETCLFVMAENDEITITVDPNQPSGRVVTPRLAMFAAEGPFGRDMTGKGGGQ